MKGETLAAILEKELKKRGISKKEFCQAIGVSQATFSHWANGSVPSPKRLADIEAYLGIILPKEDEEPPIDEATQLRELLRDRQDLRVLLHSAKDVPPSSVYTLLAQLEKMKEDKA